MEGKWDAVVIGAGIGGLSAAALLARQGRRTLVIEKDDRVGGRAMSLKGEEVSVNGPDWYRRLLAGQYTCLAASSPSLEHIASGRMLDGYTLDLGFHGVSCAGEGYFAELYDLVGGFGRSRVVIQPFSGGTVFKGDLIVDPTLAFETDMDPRMAAELERIGRDMLDFVGDLADDLSAERFEELEKLSLHDHLVNTGLDRSDLVYTFYRCIGTLVSTINNPRDISVGDILRYTMQVIIPLIVMSGEMSMGGFVRDGVMEWSKALAGRFEELGGEVRLGTRLVNIEIEGGKVAGVVVETDGRQEWLEAGTVVFGVPIQELFDYADESAFPPGFTSRVKKLYGYGSITPFFGLNDLVIPRDHAELLVKTPCVVRKEEGFDWDVYMAWSVQSYIDPSCAPQGKHLLAAYLPVTEKEALDRELVARVVKAVPDFLESLYPGFKRTVDWELYPVCWKLEGVAKSVSQAGSLKPDVIAPGVEGLYFAGDTVRGYGVAMDCACSSGILCASAITGEDFGVY